METTTVKLSKRTKVQLERLRRQHETYDQAIARLLASTDERDARTKLVAGYKATSARNRAVDKEWETADVTWPEY